jgi:hypothetical protein
VAIEGKQAEFEAEINRTCPTHGFRGLGILSLGDSRNPKLDELVARYDLRRFASTSGARRTKDGRPCRAYATEGVPCYFHANPNKASELGRIEGRRNRYVWATESSDFCRKENATEVRDITGRLIAEIYTGKLNPRVAFGLAPLMNLQLRAIEATDLERRLTKLEKLLAATGDVKLSDIDFGHRSNFCLQASRAMTTITKNGQSREL